MKEAKWRGLFFITQLSLTPIEMHLEFRRQCSGGMIMKQTIHMWRAVKFRELGPPLPNILRGCPPTSVCLAGWLAACLCLIGF